VWASRTKRPTDLHRADGVELTGPYSFPILGPISFAGREKFRLTTKTRRHEERSVVRSLVGEHKGRDAVAIKFKIARELEKAMSERKITKAEMARRLKTSRTGVDRLLDPENTSITLNTMAKVAQLLGKRIEFVLQ
jgi:antitoxin HicB